MRRFCRHTPAVFLKQTLFYLSELSSTARCTRYAFLQPDISWFWGLLSIAAFLTLMRTAVPFGGQTNSNSKWFVPKTGVRFSKRLIIPVNYQKLFSSILLICSWESCSFWCCTHRESEMRVVDTDVVYIQKVCQNVHTAHPPNAVERTAQPVLPHSHGTTYAAILYRSAFRSLPRLLYRVGVDRCCFLCCYFLSCRQVLTFLTPNSLFFRARPRLNFLPTYLI